MDSGFLNRRKSRLQIAKRAKRPCAERKRPDRKPAKQAKPQKAGPQSAQQTIPHRERFKDGICRINDKRRAAKSERHVPQQNGDGQECQREHQQAPAGITEMCFEVDPGRAQHQMRAGHDRARHYAHAVAGRQRADRLQRGETEVGRHAIDNAGVTPKL